jgi:hypothetical protein
VHRKELQFCSFGAKSQVATSELQGLLFRLGLTKSLEYKVTRIPRPEWEEFRATMEIYDENHVVGKHTSPAFRLTCEEAVIDATWQAMASLNYSRCSNLRGTIYSYYPRRRRGTAVFRASSVKATMSKNAMFYSQNLTLDLSIYLLSAERDSYTRLVDSEATIHVYQRMSEG